MNIPAGTGNGRTLTPARVMTLSGVTAVTLRTVPASRWPRALGGLLLLMGTVPGIVALIPDPDSGAAPGCLVFAAVAGAYYVVTGLRLRPVHWVLVTQQGREVGLFASTDEAAARAIYAEAAAEVR